MPNIWWIQSVEAGKVAERAGTANDRTGQPGLLVGRGARIIVRVKASLAVLEEAAGR
jgi:hypothetical protein